MIDERLTNPLLRGDVQHNSFASYSDARQAIIDSKVFKYTWESTGGALPKLELHFELPETYGTYVLSCYAWNEDAFNSELASYDPDEFYRSEHTLHVAVPRELHVHYDSTSGYTSLQREDYPPSEQELALLNGLFDEIDSLANQSVQKRKAKNRSKSASDEAKYALYFSLGFVVFVLFCNWTRNPPPFFINIIVLAICGAISVYAINETASHNPGKSWLAVLSAILVVVAFLLSIVGAVA
ncbi:hypothetical protein PG2029B_1226 [Bifidobacterium pseudolongum subsp. globosum]|uniref:Uncharacterized protein n=2 Tax=Bifidobacterium pseudolongum TaxID=1694 RepID=A0A4Q5AEC8_9BIFI|nr:hypothetical protein PG2032B_1225 [Bifidobacterium pseudolongum subsp. globosum]RYQ28621.1 hypothetical protein PG2029B_1226 [Bifidobacterium pseudolongum subsp. globosum]